MSELGLSSAIYQMTLEQFRDITDRKNAEMLLSRTRQRLELALSTSRIGVFEYNPETGLVIADKRICEIYGFGEEAETYHASRLGAIADVLHYTGNEAGALHALWLAEHLPQMSRLPHEYQLLSECLVNVVAFDAAWQGYQEKDSQTVGAESGLSDDASNE